MRTYLLKNVALLFVLLVVLSCAMTKPPLQRDEIYPASWQDIDSLGPECKGLEGVYSNQGVFFDPKGNEQILWLTDILPAKIEGKPKTIYLKVVTQKINSNRDTFAKLEIHAYDENKALKKFGECRAFCIKHALFFVSKMNNAATPYLGLYGSQQNVWLTHDKERALVAKIWDYGAGFFAIVPLYKRPSYTWARFARFEDCDPQRGVPPDRRESEPTSR